MGGRVEEGGRGGETAEEGEREEEGYVRVGRKWVGDDDDYKGGR